MSDVGTEDFFFDYSVSISPKDNRGGNAKLKVVNGSVINNIVHIVTTPTNINFTAAALNDTVLSGGGTATLYFGTVTNYADFQATSVAVSAAASVSGTTGGLTAAAAIDSTGKVSVSMEGLKKGEYTVTVTLSAAGCTSVTTSAAKVTVISDKEDPEPPTPTTKALVVTAASGAYHRRQGRDPAAEERRHRHLHRDRLEQWRYRDRVEEQQAQLCGHRFQRFHQR